MAWRMSADPWDKPKGDGGGGLSANLMTECIHRIRTSHPFTRVPHSDARRSPMNGPGTQRIVRSCFSMARRSSANSRRR